MHIRDDGRWWECLCGTEWWGYGAICSGEPPCWLCRYRALRPLARLAQAIRWRVSPP
jgi:hypothetical protein